MDYTNIKEKMEKAINSYAERLAEVRAVVLTHQY